MHYPFPSWPNSSPTQGGGDEEWWLTIVYDPATDSQKHCFLEELHLLRHNRAGSPWLICGDFKMIYQASNKNNNMLNRRWMGQFRRFLNEAFLREIHLHDPLFYARKRFHFRSFWPRFPGFMEVVERACHCPLHNADPFSRLAWLLRNTTRCLQSWSAKSIGNIRVQLSITFEVVHQLESACDHRPLAPHEEALRQALKLKSLSLTLLQRMIAR
jgi:hypothetical protein